MQVSVRLMRRLTYLLHLNCRVVICRSDLSDPVYVQGAGPRKVSDMLKGLAAPLCAIHVSVKMHLAFADFDIEFTGLGFTHGEEDTEMKWLPQGFLTKLIWSRLWPRTDCFSLEYRTGLKHNLLPFLLKLPTGSPLSGADVADSLARQAHSPRQLASHLCPVQYFNSAGLVQIGGSSEMPKQRLGCLVD